MKIFILYLWRWDLLSCCFFIWNCENECRIEDENCENECRIEDENKDDFQDNICEVDVS